MNYYYRGKDQQSYSLNKVVKYGLLYRGPNLTFDNIKSIVKENLLINRELIRSNFC